MYGCAEELERRAGEEQHREPGHEQQPGRAQVRLLQDQRGDNGEEHERRQHAAPEAQLGDGPALEPPGEEDHGREPAEVGGLE